MNKGMLAKAGIILQFFTFLPPWCSASVEEASPISCSIEQVLQYCHSFFIVPVN